MKKEFKKLIELNQNYSIINKCEKNLNQNQNLKKLQNLKKSYDTLGSKLKKYKTIASENKKEYEKISKITEFLEEDLKKEEYILMNECGSDIKKINNVQHKVDKLKKEEEKQLSSMDIYLEKERNAFVEAKATEEELSKIKKDFYSLKEEVMVAKKESQAEIKKAKDNIEKLQKDIPEELINKYIKVKNNKSKPIVYVNNDICGGCKVGIASLTKNKLNRGKELIYCDNCGRIIFPGE